MSKPSAKRATTRAAAKSAPPLYVRGPYALKRREGRANLEIVWYDQERGREVQESAKTADLETAIRVLDNKYMDATGGPACCEHCGQTLPKANGVVLQIISDYRVSHGNDQISAKGIAHRLDHVERYVREVLKRPDLRTGDITEKWVERFRDWMKATPYMVGPEGNKRPKLRAASTVESSVTQLHAAIVGCGEKPGFKPLALKELSRTPEYRADVATLAAMFRYCLYPEGPTTAKARARLANDRKSLLAFLRLAVATWARPDALLDASTAPERKQWSKAARVFHLNPVGRRQTHKHRPSLPVPEVVGQWLDTVEGPVVATWSKSTWLRMAEALGFPLGNGESGSKLIRRSMAALAADANVPESKISRFMGHSKDQNAITEVYMLNRPERLGPVVEFNARVIGQIEALCPGAFHTQADGPTADNVIPLGSRKAA